MSDSSLPGWRRPLAVVAHPDDESFGLGALLASFTEAGARAEVLCFTHGEASTLHGRPGDLRRVRAEELAAAAAALVVAQVRLLDHPDGALSTVEPAMLADEVEKTAREQDCDGLLVFDIDGVTGHPDHAAATSAALSAGRRLGLPVLAWALPSAVAEQLNTELGTAFTGRPADRLDITVTVDRTRQLHAVRAHPSQAVPGSALWRRLDLLGDREHLRWLATARR